MLNRTASEVPEGDLRVEHLLPARRPDPLLVGGNQWGNVHRGYRSLAALGHFVLGELSSEVLFGTTDSLEGLVHVDHVSALGFPASDEQSHEVRVAPTEPAPAAHLHERVGSR